VKIGELLVAKKLITWAQLEEALDAKRYYGGRLGSNLVEMGFISEDQLALCLSEQLEVPYVRPEEVASIPGDIIAKVPRKLAEKYRVVPLRATRHELFVAVADPSLVDQIDELGFALDLRIRPLIITEVTLNYALERYYGVPRPVRLLAVPGSERPPEGGEVQPMSRGPQAAAGSGEVPMSPPGAVRRPSQPTMPTIVMPALTPASMPRAVRAPVAPPQPLPLPHAPGPVPLKPALPTPPATALASAQEPPIPSSGTSLADSPYAAHVLPIVKRAEKLPVAPAPRPALPPARSPAAATRSPSDVRSPVETLAEVMSDADVLRAVLWHLAAQFERVVMLAFAGGTATGVCASGVSVSQREIEAIQVPVAPWSLLHEASMSPRLIHEEQTQDAAVTLVCKSVGMVPGLLTLIPIHEGRRAVYVALGQGRDLDWVQGNLIELKSFLHKVGCALQIVSLRSQILGDE